MKKIAALLAFVLVLFVGALWFAASNANSLIARYKPELEAMASKSIGSDVSLGEFSVSIFPRTAIEISELKVSDPNSKEAVTLNNLLLKIKLGALLGKRLEITELLVNEPTITLKRDKQGVISIAGLPSGKKDGVSVKDGKVGVKKPTDTETPGGERVAQDSSNTQNPDPTSDFKVALEGFSVSDARVNLSDQSTGKKAELAKVSLVGGIALSGGRLDLNKLSISGKVLDSGDLSATGQVVNVGASDSSIEFDGSLSSLALNKALELAAIWGTALPLNLDGTTSLQFSAKGALANPDIIITNDLTDTTIVMDGTLEKERGSKFTLDTKAKLPTGGDLKASTKVALAGAKLLNLGTTISDFSTSIDTTVTTQKQTALIQNLSMSLGASPITGEFIVTNQESKMSADITRLSGFGGETSGSFGFNPKSTEFDLLLKSSNVAIHELLSAAKPSLPKTIEGVLTKLDLKLKGKKDGDMMGSLVGSTPLVIERGKLVGIGLVNDVLSAVKDLPFLTGSLIAHVPAGEKNAATSKDTVIHRLSTAVTIAGGAVNLRDLVVVSDLFTLDGGGTLGFDGQIKMATTITFTPAFSAALAATTKELNKALDAKGQLVIPLVLQGKAPKIVVLPNLEKLLKTAGERIIKDKAADLVNKALEKKGFGGLNLGF